MHFDMKVVKQMRGIATLQRGDLQNQVFLELRHADKQLLYAAFNDQRMKQLLGRVNLNKAQLEQFTDGLIIHEAKRLDTTSARKFILKSTDATTLDAWFDAIYSAITNDYRIKLPVHKKLMQMNIRVTRSLRDEQSDKIEFELSCEFLWSYKGADKSSETMGKSVWMQHEWKVWKTQTELHTLHRRLQTMLQSSIKHLIFPRERRRDLIFFRGLRKRFLQELKEQQMGLYFDQLTALSTVCADPQVVEIFKQSLDFDTYFEQVDVIGSRENLLLRVEEDVSEKQEDSQDSSPVNVYARQSEADAQTCASPAASVPDFQIEQLARNDSVPEVMFEQNLDDRNKVQADIVEGVRACVSYQEDRVEEFHHMTREFGRGKLQASEIAAYLYGLLGGEKCCQIMLEMAKLLPDERKREQLLEARQVAQKRAYRQNKSRQARDQLNKQRTRRGQVLAKDRPKSEKWMRQGNSTTTRTTHRRKTMFANVPIPCPIASDAAEEARLEPIDEARFRNQENWLENSSCGDSRLFQSLNRQQEQGMGCDDNQSPKPLDSRRSYLFSSSSEDTDDEKQLKLEKYAPGQDTGSNNGLACARPFSNQKALSKSSLSLRDIPNHEFGDQERCISELSNSLHESLPPRVISQPTQPDHARLDSIRKKTRPPSIRDRHQQLQEKKKLQINDQQANPVLARLKKQGAVNFMAF
uniref:Uncharacterized protein AlNc14C95G5846 n=1 Tax=Albugo laibachii Nc14 TaxID=890382 RepID=F0WGX0_9STRA|nr:conserved hypothetical protein [Albugo laibachii Nc14]|eukprot:CCA20485.1 conserved hypothetical protein [Albugo laibachii Nc14]